MSGFSSMLSLATVTLSPRSLAISSSAGAIIRHGPHHSAQKSTRTGPSAPSTSLAKLWSVTVFVAMAAISCELLTAIWALGECLSRRNFIEQWAGRVEQRSGYGAALKDYPKRFHIGFHLAPVRYGDLLARGGHFPRLEVDDRYAAFLD